MPKHGTLRGVTTFVMARKEERAFRLYRGFDNATLVTCPLEVLFWKVRILSQHYLHQLCTDTRCHPENLSGAINDRDEWRERGGQCDLMMMMMMMMNHSNLKKVREHIGQNSWEKTTKLRILV